MAVEMILNYDCRILEYHISWFIYEPIDEPTIQNIQWCLSMLNNDSFAMEQIAYYFITLCGFRVEGFCMVWIFRLIYCRHLFIRVRFSWCLLQSNINKMKQPAGDFCRRTNGHICFVVVGDAGKRLLNCDSLPTLFQICFFMMCSRWLLQTSCMLLQDFLYIGYTIFITGIFVQI
jgi:hypothetical protein